MKHFTKSLIIIRARMIMLAVVLFLSPSLLKAQTVVDIIVNSEDHTTLEAAVIAADLAGTLSGDGPFTVFAPTDAAFEALPEGLLDALLAEPDGFLTDILLYHVVGASALSTSLSDEQVIATLNGQNLTVSITSEGVFINGSKVIVADLAATNGVVHVVDAVMVPEEIPATVVDIVVNSEIHTTLEAAVIAADLATTLSGDGPFTVFAPTDAAFEALPEGLLDALLAEPNGFLTDILLYHVVSGNVLSSGLSNGQMVTTINGKTLEVTINDDGVFINGAKVVLADLVAKNGVVHVIDAVLVPSFDVSIADNATHGQILTDSEGNTLYFFTPDAQGNSTCVDGCLNNWPVFYAENLILPEGLNPDDFDSIDRGEGVMQSTYKGWPLYYFANDNAPGDVNGEGLINKWFVAKPDYTVMLMDNQLVGNDGVNYTPDYSPGDSIVQYLVDAYGNTLYTWSNDRNNRNRFTAADLSNNGAWPIFTQTDMIVPSTLSADDFAVIDVYGNSQLTFKGWPLYFFGQDAMRGDTKGVSVPQPGVWPVAVPTIDAAPDYTVVDVVVSSADHTTLEAAVIAADLAGTLSGEGPFTVFAPTDDAFAALPEGLLDDLLAEPEGLLTDILLYHVVGANALSSSLSDGQMITTLNRQPVEVTITHDGVFINGAKVIVADVVTDNGVVHVIDAVLVPDEIPATVVDIIVGSDVHTTLEAAVIAAALADTLSGDGPFTVFAPTDDAFAALPEGLLDTLLTDPSGFLTDILLYHVVSADALSSSLSDGQMIVTLNGQSVEVSITDDGVFINGAKVIVADLLAENGVVHVIDAVLVPEVIPATVVDIIVESEIHTTLEAAVIAADLAGTLSGDGPFTVFAPSDDAFAALPEGLLDTLLADPSGFLTDILLYHVVGANALSSSLSDGQMIGTINGQSVEVTITDEGVFINGAKVIVADLVAKNGVVHVIDAVLVPEDIPATVVDIIVGSEIHTTLEAAVIAADLAGTLSGDGPFTVFAPTDDAFAALPEGLLDTLLADPSGFLTDILLYHVVGANALSSSLSDGQMIGTINGQSVEVTITDEGVFINGAKVIVADLVAENGVVHVIDAVLVPEEIPATVVDIIVGSEIHTTLEAAVIAADLAGTLSGDGPFTVFAPTDDAFAALPEGLLNDLLAEPAGMLTDILLYHVVGANALSTSLSNGQMIATLFGENVEVTINDDGVFINDAKVIVADLVAENGVVHVIDAVLVPTTTNTESVFSDTRGVMLYPNPAQNFIYLEAEMKSQAKVSIEVYNIVGKQVMRYELENQHDNLNERIDISALPQGVYIFNISSNKEVISRKINVFK